MKDKYIKKLTYIEAYSSKEKKIYHWNRGTIGNIIENIPKLIEKDGFWENIKLNL